MGSKARRAHGTGSIWTEQRATGEVWMGQVRVAGKQRQRTLGRVRSKGAADGLTRAMAERALREFRADTEHETQQARERAAQAAGEAGTLRAVALDHLRHLDSADKKASTLADYRGYLDRHLLPFFSDVPLREVRVRDVEDFIRHQRTQVEVRRRDPRTGERIVKRGLDPATVSNHVNYLHAIFAFAQRREIVQHNPVAPASKPKAQPRTSDFSFLTLAQVEAVVRSVQDDYLGSTDRTVILTAALTGLRAGELTALRWRDVLWADSAIRVAGSVSRGVEGTPKSHTSRREVPMGDRVARALELHHRATRYGDDDNRVFCHPHTGNPYDHGKMRDRFYQAMRAAGLGHMLGRDGGGIVFHSLRHTFGAQMASAGAPLVAIKEWMGHADIQTTMIYARWGKDRAAERRLVDAAFAVDDRFVERLPLPTR